MALMLKRQDLTSTRRNHSDTITLLSVYISPTAVLNLTVSVFFELQQRYDIFLHKPNVTAAVEQCNNLSPHTIITQYFNISSRQILRSVHCTVETPGWEARAKARRVALDVLVLVVVVRFDKIDGTNASKVWSDF